MKSKGDAMGDDVMTLLNAHEYFHGIDDATLRQIVDTAKVLHFSAGTVVHQLNEPLTSLCFVLQGRLKCVRVDPRGEEHPFRMIERGDQYGIMLGILGEALPVRVFALESSTVLSLDHETAMELMFQHPELRRRWLQTYAGTMRRHFFQVSSTRSPKLLALVHSSPGTRHLAHKLIQRLQELAEDVAVLSDTDSWRSVPDIRFRALLDGGRSLEVPEIRQQIVEWREARRIVFDIAGTPNPTWVAQSMIADHILVFVRTGEISSALQQLRALDVRERGLRDKIGIVWVLEGDRRVAPVVPEFSDYSSREFTLSESQLSPRQGRVLSNGMERLAHHLRGVRVGVALGGGAARGMSHLGVLKALEQNGIVVDMVAGTSAGALTGTLYCSGMDCDYAATQFAADLTVPWPFRSLPNGNYWYLLYKYRLNLFDPMLRKYLADWRLEQLPLPCLAVSVDLVGSQVVVRDRGDAVHAILESINLPGLSRPICRDGQALVDGGLLNNIPADVLAARGCNFVIAVSVTARIERQFGGNQPDTPTSRMRTPSTVQTLLRSLQVQNHNLNALGVQGAEVTIEPDATRFDLAEFMRARELAVAGEQAALGQISQIKQLLARLDPQLFKAGS